MPWANRQSAALVVAEGVVQSVLFKPGIGIEKEEEFSFRRLSALMAGPGFAAPTVGKRFGGYDLGARIGSELGGAVG